jgi:hypothetical protein
MYGCAKRLAILPCALFSLPAIHSTPSSCHEVCSIVELAQTVLHAVREHEHFECLTLQLEYNMTRESRVFRERIVNVSKVKMVRQN